MSTVPPDKDDMSGATPSSAPWPAFVPGYRPKPHRVSDPWAPQPVKKSKPTPTPDAAQTTKKPTPAPEAPPPAKKPKPSTGASQTTKKPKPPAAPAQPQKLRPPAAPAQPAESKTELTGDHTGKVTRIPSQTAKKPKPPAPSKKPTAPPVPKPGAGQPEAPGELTGEIPRITPQTTKPKPPPVKKPTPPPVPKPGESQPEAPGERTGEMPRVFLPPPQPVPGKPRQRKRWLIPAIGLVVLALIVGMLVFTLRASTPESVVKTYLAALARSDAAKALSLAATPPANTDLLTHDVLAATQAKNPLTKVDVKPASGDPDTGWVVPASYRLGSTPVMASFTVLKVDGQMRLKSVARTITSTPPLPSGLTLEGQPIGEPLTLFPGVYEWSHLDPALSVNPSTLVVAFPEDGAIPDRPKIGLTADGLSRLRTLAASALDSCLAEKALLTTCDFGFTDLVGKGTPDPATVKWSYHAGSVNNVDQAAFTVDPDTGVITAPIDITVDVEAYSTSDTRYADWLKLSQVSVSFDQTGTAKVTFKPAAAASNQVALDFAPHPVATTSPAYRGVQEAIQVNGMTVSSYQRQHPINLPSDGSYSQIPGVVTFRGDNLRSTGSFGTANVTQKKFAPSPWVAQTGALGSWFGNGWSGQPLLVQWPADVRNVLQRNDAAKAKDGLVEAVYASMDGYVHLYDAETGQPTRDPLWIGFTFKGAGSVDPRGIPILYAGSGVSGPNGPSHVFVISLVDGRILYEFAFPDGFAPRSWQGMDSSALVDAASDTLIYCGENGLIYTVHLNTSWDPATGQLSVNPDEVVKYRYSTSRSGEGRYWYGIESSPVILGHYLMAGDNGGNLICVDLNTMSMVWIADTIDDTNGSAVMEIEADGKPYIYITPSLHFTAVGSQGDMPIFKFDATTGETVWAHPYHVFTVPDLSGGSQATVALGKQGVADLIFLTMARLPNYEAGRLVALDKKTGQEVWALPTAMYSWSSPVLVYDPTGKAYLISADSGGTIYLIDARTGDVLDKFESGANVEATPAVYGDRVVVGTRGMQIFGLQIV